MIQTRRQVKFYGWKRITQKKYTNDFGSADWWTHSLYIVYKMAKKANKVGVDFFL